MKCPFCDAWSDVKETRATTSGRVRRTRQCANGHTFPTYEAPPPRQQLLARRNKQAAIQVMAGNTITEVAASFKMPRADLNRYMLKHHPSHNYRTAGQLRRWALRKAK